MPAGDHRSIRRRLLDTGRRGALAERAEDLPRRALPPSLNFQMPAAAQIRFFLKAVEKGIY